MNVILELFYINYDIGEFIRRLHLLHPHFLPNGVAASESPTAKIWAKRLKEKPNDEQTTGDLFMATNKGRDERLISWEELCDWTGWDPMTVFDKADNGEIPGAVWGKTLRFKKEKVEAWLQPLTKSEIEEVLKSLEQRGLITSFIDSNGERRYICPEHLH